MRDSLWTLIFLLATFFSGSHALQTRPELVSLEPRLLETRQSASATCSYSATHLPSAKQNRYHLSIRLPGIWWTAICRERLLVQRVTDPIQHRCTRTWAEKGLNKIYDGQFEARVEDGKCVVKIEVAIEANSDESFPTFHDDCVLAPRPELCGLRPKYVPWPSDCHLTEVGHRNRPNSHLKRKTQVDLSLLLDQALDCFADNPSSRAITTSRRDRCPTSRRMAVEAIQAAVHKRGERAAAAAGKRELVMGRNCRAVSWSHSEWATQSVVQTHKRSECAKEDRTSVQT